MGKSMVNFSTPPLVADSESILVELARDLDMTSHDLT